MYEDNVLSPGTDTGDQRDHLKEESLESAWGYRNLPKSGFLWVVLCSNLAFDKNNSFLWNKLWEHTEKNYYFYTNNTNN